MLDSRCHESPTGLTPAKKPSKSLLALDSGRFTNKEIFKPNALYRAQHKCEKGERYAYCINSFGFALINICMNSSLAYVNCNARVINCVFIFDFGNLL